MKKVLHSWGPTCSFAAVPAAKEHTFAEETHEQAALWKELNTSAWARRKREASHNSCPSW